MDLCFPILGLVGLFKFDEGETDPLDKTCFKSYLFFIIVRIPSSSSFSAMIVVSMTSLLEALLKYSCSLSLSLSLALCLFDPLLVHRLVLYLGRCRPVLHHCEEWSHEHHFKQRCWPCLPGKPRRNSRSRYSWSDHHRARLAGNSTPLTVLESFPSVLFLADPALVPWISLWSVPAQELLAREGEG